MSSQTTFHYRQKKNILRATYSGGEIIQGTLIGLVDSKGYLEFRYNYINKNNQIRSGKCHSTPEILADGRIKLHEKWIWSNGGESQGESIVEGSL